MKTVLSISISLLAAAVVVSLMSLGCSQNEESISGRDNIPAFYVNADGSNPRTTRDTLENRYPHLLMEDGTITLNDRCPVRKASLNRRLPSLFVNDKPIGFC